MDILHQLQRKLPELSKKLALAAQYALDNPDRIALESMRSSAKVVGVTSPTMLRLARQMGFESYDEFRACFQDELVKTGFGARAGALQEDINTPEGSQALSDRLLNACERNIQDAARDLDHDTLNRIATLIRNAPSCYLVGTGSGFWLASLMKTTGTMALSNLRVVGGEYAVASEALGHLTPEDVVIGFGVNPIAVRTVEGLRYANEVGATAIAFVDNPASPLVAQAQHFLSAPASSPHYYPSLVTMTALVELVLATVVATGEGTELERIAKLEARRQASDRYIEY